MLHLSPHPALHAVFEALGYTLGFALYRRLRRGTHDPLSDAERWSVIAAASLGALLGSRILGLLEQAPRLHISLLQAFLPGGGKTIVGGLLGGWLAVELLKRAQGIHTRSGDLFVLPLCLGIAVGRIGCFLAGLADDTFGLPTRSALATRFLAVDFGDGIPRHPTQLYEIAFLAVLALALHTVQRRAARRGHPLPNGALFRLFLAAYLLWRLAIDLLKPQPLVAGLNLIQWACLAGLLALAFNFAYTHHARHQKSRSFWAYK